MTATKKGLHEQDLQDLHDQWRRDMDELRKHWTEEASRKAMASFNAVLEYIHAGEEPDVSDMKDGTLYKIEKEPRKL